MTNCQPQSAQNVKFGLLSSAYWDGGPSPVGRWGGELTHFVITLAKLMHRSTFRNYQPAVPDRQPDPQRRCWPTLTALLIGLMVIIAACSSSISDSSVGSDRSVGQLDTVPGGGIGVFDGAWQLVEFSLSEASPDNSAQPKVDISDIFLLLDVEDVTSTIVVSTNCNRRSGSYTLSQNQNASITLPGSTTQVCDANAAMLEELGIGLLESVVSWDLEGDDLTLISDYAVNQGASNQNDTGQRARTELVFRLVE